MTDMTDQAFECSLEAAGSGTSLGTLTIAPSILDVDSDCWVDLQQQVLLHIRRSNTKAVAHSFKQVKDARQVRLFDEHNGSELTPLNSSLCELQSCCLAWAKWREDMLRSRMKTISKVLAVGVYTLHDNCLWTHSDKQYCLSVVSRKGQMLQYVCARLRDDEDIVRAAVSQDCAAFQWASRQLQQKDDIFFLTARTLANHGVCINTRYFSELCRRRCCEMSKPEALHAVQQAGLLLEYMSADVRRDPDVVMAALRQTPKSFMFAHYTLYTNKEVMLLAMQVAPNACWHVGGFLVRDPDIANCLTKQGCMLKYTAGKPSKDFVIDQVSKNGMSLVCVPAFQRDPDVVKAAVTQNGKALQFAHTSLRTKKDIVMSAVCCDGRALAYACDDLRSENDIVLAAIKQAPEASRFALGHDCRDLFKFAIKRSKAACFAIEDFCFQNKPQDCVYMGLLAVKHYDDALQYIQSEKRTNQVIYGALKASPRALAYMELGDFRNIHAKQLAKHVVAFCDTSEAALGVCRASAMECCSHEVRARVMSLLHFKAADKNLHKLKEHQDKARETS